MSSWLCIYPVVQTAQRPGGVRGAMVTVYHKHDEETLNSVDQSGAWWRLWACFCQYIATMCRKCRKAMLARSPQLSYHYYHYHTASQQRDNRTDCLNNTATSRVFEIM